MKINNCYLIIYFNFLYFGHSIFLLIVTCLINLYLYIILFFIFFHLFDLYIFFIQILVIIDIINEFVFSNTQ
jgi:hypothetical protein